MMSQYTAEIKSINGSWRSGILALSAIGAAKELLRLIGALQVEVRNEENGMSWIVIIDEMKGRMERKT
jgi:hypothetical protein